MIHNSKDESALGLIAVGAIMVLMAAMLGEICGHIAPAGPGEAKPHVAQETTSPRPHTEQDLKHSE